MFKFIRKQDVEELFLSRVHRKMGWKPESVHLKTWQDLAVFDVIAKEKNKVIGEIGGGVSRVLPVLKTSNTLYNIEKFEGEGNGPKELHSIKGVSVINCYVGDSQGLISDAFFDIMFSVSVIEHIPNPSLQAFFDDHVRALKPGGLGIHAIDFYVESGLEKDDNEIAQKRLELYLDILSANPQIDFLQPPADRVIRFASDFATNSDQGMFAWNKTVPSLADKRRRAQSISLMIGFKKKK